MPFLRERSGRPSFEKIVAFIGAVAPILWLAWRTYANDLGPRPFDEATHVTGDWTVRFILLALAISPARRIFNAPKLIAMRRTLGVAAFGYALVHFALYIGGEHLNLWKVATEIVLRFYLTIGFVAFLGLCALASTSWDAAIKRIGSARWNRLHSAVYVIAVLAIIHFLLQSKLNVYEPTMMAGFLVWLFGYRLLHRFTAGVGRVKPFALAIAAGVITALGETGWYAFATGADAWRVFSAQFQYAYELRPAAWVLIVTLGIAVAALAWSFVPQRKPARARAPRASAGATQSQPGS